MLLRHLPHGVRLFLRLFLRTASRRGPLQGDGPLLVWLGDVGRGWLRDIGRSRFGTRLRLNGIGNADILAALGTLNNKTGTRFVYHHVVLARRTAKVNIHFGQTAPFHEPGEC